MAHAMKDSGLEWIGEMPKDWQTIKIKFTSWLKGRIGWQGLKSNEYTDEGPYLITGTDFCDGYINWDTCVHISEERFEEAPEIHIKEDDLLITKDGTVGKVAIARFCPEKVSLNSGVLLIRNIGQYKYHDKYLYYVLLSDVFWKWYENSQAGHSTIRHLYQEQFYNFSYPYPSLNIQKRISTYLDERCAKINKILSDVKNTLDDYKKYKQSIITEAVTKGLNPNAELKDSGIEWIGRIPKNWQITPLKFICKIYGRIGFRGYTADDLVDEGEGPITLSPSNFTGMKLSYKKCSYISWEKYYESPEIQIHNGDILYVKTASVGKSCRVSDLPCEATINPQIVVIKNIKINPQYLSYLFQSDIMRVQTELAVVGGTIPTIAQEKINNYKVIIPEKDEQDKISNYLDVKCAKIDKLIATKEALIEDFEAYKKSLIYEYVTGKKEVI